MHRSKIIPANIGDLLDTAAHPKAAIHKGAQQYETPIAIARELAMCLPDNTCANVLDPQCANGNLLKPFDHFSTERYGIDIDNTLDPSSTRHHLTAPCTWAWEALDECWPELKWDCIVSNPPFGITWKDTGKDSTLSTWDWTMSHLAEHGYGYMIANNSTIQRLSIHEHPSIYAWLTYDTGWWDGVEVDIGVLFYWKDTWDKGCYHKLHNPTQKGYDTIWRWIQREFENDPRSSNRTEHPQTRKDIWNQLAIMRKERTPTHNLVMRSDGTLAMHLSTREKLKRKLTSNELLRLHQLNGRTPMALTTDADTRALLREVTSPGAGYTVHAEASTAIQDALEAVATQATCPIMPVTDFQATAYADECDTLECIQTRDGFTVGRRYPVRSGTYEFSEQITRIKQHVSESTGHISSENHHCELTGRDRYIQLTNDAGREHRYMSHPKAGNDRPDLSNAPSRGTTPNASILLTGRDAKLPNATNKATTHIEHHETELWQTFAKPPIQTAKEARPDLYQLNLEGLAKIEQLINNQ